MDGFTGFNYTAFTALKLARNNPINGLSTGFNDYYCVPFPGAENSRTFFDSNALDKTLN